jgi:hypothetical protein
MQRFRMSRPELAVEVVAVLTDLGYGAGVELPTDGDTASFVLAWSADGHQSGTDVAALVRHVDRRAVEQHEPERDAFGDERRSEDLLDADSSGRTNMRQARRHHTVNPRRVWSGVSCAAIGIVVTAVGLMAQTWWVVGVGVALVALGAVAIVAGGGMYDVHATRPLDAELHEVRTGDEHEGVEPGEMVEDPRVERSAAEIERGRQRLMARAVRRRRPR